jgi:hypothetical protein
MSRHFPKETFVRKIACEQRLRVAGLFAFRARGPAAGAARAPRRRIPARSQVTCVFEKSRDLTSHRGVKCSRRARKHVALARQSQKAGEARLSRIFKTWR